MLKLNTLALCVTLKQIYVYLRNMMNHTVKTDILSLVSSLPTSLSYLNRFKNAKKYQLLCNATLNLTANIHNMEEEDIAQALAHILSITFQHTYSSDEQLTKSGQYALSLLQGVFRYTLFNLIQNNTQEYKGTENRYRIEDFIQQRTQRPTDYSGNNVKEIFEATSTIDLFKQPQPTDHVAGTILIAMQAAYKGLTQSRLTDKDINLLNAMDEYIEGIATNDSSKQDKAIITFVTEVQKHNPKPFHFHKQPKSATIFFNTLTKEAKEHINHIQAGDTNHQIH